MELSNVLNDRCSIRSFKEQTVPRDLLVQLIEAACQAPTASNLQAWRFIIVDEPELVRKTDLFCPGLSGKPPVIIIVASDLDEVNRRGSANSLAYGCMMDAAMACENLLLKAVDLGLGGCAIKSYNDVSIRSLLNLPESLRIEILISIGYPMDVPKKKPARKAINQVLFYNQYESTADTVSALPATPVTNKPITSPAMDKECSSSSSQDLSELLIYMITSAAGLSGEPQVYGPLRVIESAERLAKLMSINDPDNKTLQSLIKLIDEGKHKNMTDPSAFQQMLNDAAILCTKL